VIDVKVSVDTRSFDSAFRRYMLVSKKSMAEICNRKAAMIASGAIRNTRRASRGAIESELGKWVSVPEVTKKGTIRNKRTLQLNTRKGHSAPLAEVIVNKQRARAGEQGLAGDELAAAVRKMIARRFSSIGFLASSWLPCIRDLIPVLQERGGLHIDNTAKWFGKPKGRAVPARPGFNPLASIESFIDKSERTNRFLTEGLQKAIDDETRSMEQYIERKLQQDTAHFN
jgi:hypothetical protein